MVTANAAVSPTRRRGERSEDSVGTRALPHAPCSRGCEKTDRSGGRNLAPPESCRQRRDARSLNVPRAALMRPGHLGTLSAGGASRRSRSGPERQAASLLTPGRRGPVRGTEPYRQAHRRTVYPATTRQAEGGRRSVEGDVHEAALGGGHGWARQPGRRSLSRSARGHGLRRSCSRLSATRRRPTLPSCGTRPRGLAPADSRILGLSSTPRRGHTSRRAQPIRQRRTSRS